MARTPSTSDLCNAEANKAYDVLAVISANMEKINNLSNFIFDLKDWLKFNIGIYLNDYIIELETKCGELKEELDKLPGLIESTKEDIYQVTDAITDEVTALENQVNNLLLHIFDKNDDTHGATCKAIDNYLSSDILPPINSAMTNFQNYIKSYMDSKFAEIMAAVNAGLAKIEAFRVIGTPTKVSLSNTSAMSNYFNDLVVTSSTEFTGTAKQDMIITCINKDDQAGIDIEYVSPSNIAGKCWCHSNTSDKNRDNKGGIVILKEGWRVHMNKIHPNNMWIFPMVN